MPNNFKFSYWIKLVLSSYVCALFITLGLQLVLHGSLIDAAKAPWPYMFSDIVFMTQVPLIAWIEVRGRSYAQEVNHGV